MMAFEAQTSRWRSLSLVAGALGFVVLGLWIVGAFGGSHPDSLKAVIAGWASIVFFGACAVAGTVRMFQTGVELRIDRHGIWWRRWSDQTVPWSAIERVSVRTMQRQRFACIVLRDPRAFPSDTLAGRLAGANKALGFGDIALSTTGTARSFDDMMAAIRQFAPPGVLA